eukprot:COSAG03_NODE_8047_length_842_cov_1.313594_1_plen_36_part_10
MPVRTRATCTPPLALRSNCGDTVVGRWGRAKKEKEN